MAFEHKGTLIVNGIDYSNGGGSGGSGRDVLPDLAGTKEEFDAIKDELPDGSAFDTIDEQIENIVTDVTNEFTFLNVVTWDMSFSKIYKYGKIIKGILRFTTPSSGSDTIIITTPSNYKPLTTTVSQINRTWSGANAGTVMYLDNGNIMLVSGDWTKSVNVYTTFEYILKE